MKSKQMLQEIAWTFDSLFAQPPIDLKEDEGGLTLWQYASLTGEEAAVNAYKLLVGEKSDTRLIPPPPEDNPETLERIIDLFQSVNCRRYEDKPKNYELAREYLDAVEKIEVCVCELKRLAGLQEEDDFE